MGFVESLINGTMNVFLGPVELARDLLTEEKEKTNKELLTELLEKVNELNDKIDQEDSE